MVRIENGLQPQRRAKFLLMINHAVNQQTKTFQKAEKALSLSLFPSTSLKDVWQYYLNLTEANQKQKSDWRLEYVMTEAFGLADLRPHSLLKLGLSFWLPQAATFQRYFTHFMVSYNSSAACEGDCRLNQVCAVLFLDQLSYSKCVAQRGR